MPTDVYEKCPVLREGAVTLRRTEAGDAGELLNCYSDREAVPFFNSDNCGGDDFYYPTLRRMEQAVAFWDFSYRQKFFIRWTVIENASRKPIGTVEMFKRPEDDEFRNYGLLRIDLRSAYERREYLGAILKIADRSFYRLFGVGKILTKAVPEARERLRALEDAGFRPLGRKFLKYDHYYIREEDPSQS